MTVTVFDNIDQSEMMIIQAMADMTADESQGRVTISYSYDDAQIDDIKIFNRREHGDAIAMWYAVAVYLKTLIAEGADGEVEFVWTNHSFWAGDFFGMHWQEEWIKRLVESIQE